MIATTPAHHIRNAYRALLAYQPAGISWVSIAALREEAGMHMGSLTFSNALTDMIRTGEFTATPEENQKAIDGGLADGIHIGGEMKHYVSL